MNERVLLPGIKVNEWTNWEQKANVFYWNYSFANRRQLTDVIVSVHPHTIFINGLYSFYFNLLPLWYALKNTKARVVWSARGMLHSGALAQKSIKKQLFFLFIKILGLHQKAVWHATDEREAAFIRKKMGDVHVVVAHNYPKLVQALPVLPKQEGSLILGTIALISPMKNHKAVLEALQLCKGSVTWLIYGPVKDELYWKECLQLIQKLPSTIEVEYKGELPPSQLSDALKDIHVFIMPSESENFGHALLEALSAGKPVITTTTTPFYQLSEKKAGVAVDLNGLTSSLQQSINYFVNVQQQEYDNYCDNALAFAKAHVSAELLSKQYQNLLAPVQ